MSVLFQKLTKTPVMALFVLVACLYVLHSTTTRFLADMRHDRDEMVASLRQAQTPEPQISAISKGVDRMTSDVNSMTMSFFAFTSIVLVCTFAAGRRSDPPNQNALKHQEGVLKHEPVA